MKICLIKLLTKTKDDQKEFPIQLAPNDLRKAKKKQYKI